MDRSLMVASLLLAMLAMQQLPLAMATDDGGPDDSQADELKISGDDSEQSTGQVAPREPQVTIEQIEQSVLNLEDAIKKGKDEIEKRKERLHRGRNELNARKLEADQAKRPLSQTEQVKLMHKSMIDSRPIHRCFKLLSIFGQSNPKTTAEILVIARMDIYSSIAPVYSFNPRYLNMANSVLADLRRGQTELDKSSAGQLNACLTYRADYVGYGETVDWWKIAESAHPHKFPTRRCVTDC